MILICDTIDGSFVRGNMRVESAGTGQGQGQ
jgi:hypothetical protein